MANRNISLTKTVCETLENFCTEMKIGVIATGAIRYCQFSLSATDVRDGDMAVAGFCTRGSQTFLFCDRL